MSTSFHDCTFMGVDPDSGLYVVREQLFPEARGWIEHEFYTEAAAMAFLQDLKHPTA